MTCVDRSELHSVPDIWSTDLSWQNWPYSRNDHKSKISYKEKSFPNDWNVAKKTIYPKTIYPEPSVLTTDLLPIGRIPLLIVVRCEKQFCGALSLSVGHDQSTTAGQDIINQSTTQVRTSDALNISAQWFPACNYVRLKFCILLSTKNLAGYSHRP